jgi:hypothetical protein
MLPGCSKPDGYTRNLSTGRFSPYLVKVTYHYKKLESRLSDFLYARGPLRQEGAHTMSH